MRTLNIAISDAEYSKFGFTSQELTFSDFVDRVSKELIKRDLDAAVDAADRYGLSFMTMEDITQEVQAVRNGAKNHT